MALTKVDTQLLSNGYTTDSTGLSTISAGNLKVLATAAGTANDRKVIFQNELGTQAVMAMGTTGSSGGVNKFYIQTNAGYSLNLDANGYMTVPYQPAFYAMNTTTYSSSGYMICGTSYVNISSSYSTSTGRFTAPIAGTYCFSFNALKRTGAGRMSLYKNGSYYGAGVSQTYQGTTSEIPIAATVIITLAAGDYVQVYLSIDAGDFYGSANSHSAFSGYLIG